MKLLFLFLLSAVAVLILAPPLPGAILLEEARIFIEFNETDQDVGAHVFFDGDGWRKMRIKNPDGTVIFEVDAHGSLGEIGISEMFFEGEEPTLDELPLDEFFEHFPEGIYKFIGETVDGERIHQWARFSHKIPDGAVIVAPAEGEEVDPDEVVIAWEPVTTPAGIEIIGYQVIVGSFQITMPADATSVEVPPGYLESGTDYGFEILAIERSHNQTITAGSFVTE